MMSHRPALRQKDENKVNLQNLIRKIGKDNPNLKEQDQNNKSKKVEKALISSKVSHLVKPQQKSTNTKSLPLSKIHTKVESLYSDYQESTPTKGPKFKIFQDKIKILINQSNTEAKAISTDESTPNRKRKIHEISSLSANELKEHETQEIDEPFKNFRFDLDSTENDPSSIVFQCQIPLIRLNDWYSINQFSITKAPELSSKMGNVTTIEDEISSGANEQKQDSTKHQYRLSEIKPFNDLCKLVELIHSTDDQSLPKELVVPKSPRWVLLIAYKQSVPNFKRFQNLKVGDYIEINEEEGSHSLESESGASNTGEDTDIKTCYDWKLII